jgi:predicted nucleic-acid-binding protein
MIAIDTDVFVLAFAFHQDQRQQSNTRFLATVQHKTPAVAIYTVMELLGQLSFNLAPRRLLQWHSWLQEQYRLTIIYPTTLNQSADLFFQNEFIDRPLARLQRQRIPFLDGLILDLLERVTAVETFVTWNARHYRGKTPLSVLTPEEYLLYERGLLSLDDN